MLFEQHTPVYPLGQYIQSFIYYKDFNPAHSIERFLPDGNIEIVIDLTGAPRFIYSNETLKEIQSCRNSWISGIRTRFISIQSGSESEMFIINFKKGKVSPFVQIPLKEITDTVIDAELVLGDEIVQLRDGLLCTNAIKEKFIFAERFLMKCFGRKLQPNPFIDYALDKMLQSPDNITIADISNKVGYSQKHLAHLFHTHVGVSAKTMLRVLRFQKAISQVENAEIFSWAQVAAESGYYDQSHFIADFKKFSGFTPQAYLEQRREFLNYILVA